MKKIPQSHNLDSTLLFIRDPYRFISKQSERYQSDVFQTRLAFQNTICMTGAPQAKLFYDPARFIRKDAMPRPIQKTLTGEGGVQGMDSDAHKHRKNMFMIIVRPENVQHLAETVIHNWQKSIEDWKMANHITLYDGMRDILSRSVCQWAGVPLKAKNVYRRTQEFTALFGYAGAVGPKHFFARFARKRSEAWAQERIKHIRADPSSVEEQSAVSIIAHHRDLSGKLLDSQIAAVELLNILRPTVAVAVFITFAAHALHRYPHAQQKIIESDGDNDYITQFVQEVRRFYPFFPSVVARVKQDFEYEGYHFPQDTCTILDIYGTNHDSRVWDVPEEFYPERFNQWDSNLFNFIPQGGGEVTVTHRCPGEIIAVSLMKVAVNFLTTKIRYSVPEQDMKIDFGRLPALPKSRLVVENIELI